ncbi:hypothetical protein BSKO_00086 [Bryopsis sp. KO-2023]|nr:hypothetical protein BSKO_00086 [Bryopsis sp. KO-2023]
MARLGRLAKNVGEALSSAKCAVPQRLWNIPEKVTMYEVAPRDGLQNEKELVPTETKVELIDRLTEAGFPVIEATSFVSPKWVPQLADGGDVMKKIVQKKGTRYPVLIPNSKGWRNAMMAGVREVAIFASASEAFSEKNLNCSIKESLNKLEEVAHLADDAGVHVRGYVSCAVGCPYSGDIDPKDATAVAEALIKMGCYEVSMADTTGVGTPASVAKMFEACLERFSPSLLAAHMHDTYGQGLVNVLTSLSLGIPTIDASIAGLGGCPFAKGAKGNIATEDVVYMLNGFGVEHGIDVEKMVTASDFISKAIGQENNSRAANALLAKKG